MTAEELRSAELLQSGGLRALLWGPSVLTDVLAWAGLDDRPRRAVDLGCGRGFLSLLLADALPRTRFDGFDLDPEQVAAGRAAVGRLGLRGRVTVQEGDAESLDVQDERYDLALTHAVLVHQSRPDRVLEEARRILRPGGLLLAVEPDPSVEHRTFDPVPDGHVDPWPTLVRGAAERGAGTWAPSRIEAAVFAVFGAVATRTQGGRFTTSKVLCDLLLRREEADEEAHLELLETVFQAGGGDAAVWSAYRDALAEGRRERRRSILAGGWTVDAVGPLHLFRARRV